MIQLFSLKIEKFKQCYINIMCNCFDGGDNDS